jgi:hypothetical protein
MGLWILFGGLEEKLQHIINSFPLGTFEVEEYNAFFVPNIIPFSNFKVDSLVHYKSTGGYIRIVPIGSWEGVTSFKVIHCLNWVDWKNAPVQEMEVYDIQCLMSEVLTQSSNAEVY